MIKLFLISLFSKNFRGKMNWSLYVSIALGVTNFGFNLFNRKTMSKALQENNEFYRENLRKNNASEGDLPLNRSP